VAQDTPPNGNEAEKKGSRIRQSVCQWCFKNWDKEEFCANAQKLGLVGIDLVPIDWFETLKKYKLISTMTNHADVRHRKGLNRKENWDKIPPPCAPTSTPTPPKAFPTPSASPATAPA
jgi:hypothetical protein